jgi:hypothetical protein
MRIKKPPRKATGAKCPRKMICNGQRHLDWGIFEWNVPGNLKNNYRITNTLHLFLYNLLYLQ